MRFLFALPWTRFIVPGWTGWNKQKEVRKTIYNITRGQSRTALLLAQVVGETQRMMRDIVRQHIETYDEENMRDFVDVYLKEMAGSKDKSFTGN